MDPKESSMMAAAPLVVMVVVVLELGRKCSNLIIFNLIQFGGLLLQNVDFAFGRRRGRGRGRLQGRSCSGQTDRPTDPNKHGPCFTSKAALKALAIKVHCSLALVKKKHTLLQFYSRYHRPSLIRSEEHW